MRLVITYYNPLLGMYVVEDLDGQFSVAMSIPDDDDGNEDDAFVDLPVDESRYHEEWNVLGLRLPDGYVRKALVHSYHAGLMTDFEPVAVQAMFIIHEHYDRTYG